MVFGVAANGLEPRDSRRQLGQLERLEQSQELPVREPQQQPGEQEQQQRVRGCADPSSIPWGGTDPVIILSLDSVFRGKQRSDEARFE
jgi:hypothetical protein